MAINHTVKHPTCNKFRPVCLNVPIKSVKAIKTISKCNEEKTSNIDILEYILKEINRKNNNNNVYNTPKTNTKTENCYSTDNAWLAVIKNIETQLTEMKLEDINMEEIKNIQNELKNNETNKPIMPKLNLKELFTKIIEVAESKWGSSNNQNNTNSQIKKQIFEEFKKVSESEGFNVLSVLIDELLEGKSDLMNKLFNNTNKELKSKNETQQNINVIFNNYKTIIKNLFLYTLPIMNSETDLSNVFGRDFKDININNNNNKNKNKINRDFKEINKMLESFTNKTQVLNGGSKYNKKTKKNSGKGKRKNTHTKKNMYGINDGYRGGANWRRGNSNPNALVKLIGFVLLIACGIIYLAVYGLPKYAIYKPIKKILNIIKKKKINSNIDKKINHINNYLIIFDKLYEKINEICGKVVIDDNYKNIKIEFDKVVEDYKKIMNNNHNDIYNTNVNNETNKAVIELIKNINDYEYETINCVYNKNNEKEINQYKEEIINILTEIENNSINNLDVNDLDVKDLGEKYKNSITLIASIKTLFVSMELFVRTFYEKLDCKLDSVGDYIYIGGN